MKNLDKTELIRRKEIVEWQIRIAKDRSIIDLRELELKELNKQLLKFQKWPTNFSHPQKKSSKPWYKN